MATGTHAGSTWNTTAGNKTVVATPASGDLIVVVHGMSGWAGADDSTITDNNSDGNGTYTKIGASPLSSGGGTACALWISIRNALVGSASSTTFTATNTGDTGGGLTVMRFSSVTRTGSSAARQNKGEAGTENPPSLAFPAATLTANPIVLGVMGEDNPAGVTPPGGFSEAVDTGWSQPASGVEVCWDDAGNTASSYAWSGGALTDHNEAGVEIDTSNPEAIGTLSVTLGAVSSSGAGVVAVVGSGSPSLGAVTSSASGQVSVLGVATSTLGTLTSSATASVAVVGVATPALGETTVSASGTVEAASATGVLSETLGALTSSSTASVLVQGTASSTLGEQTLSASGTVADAQATGTLDAILGDIASISATGHVTQPEPPGIHGALAVTLTETTLIASEVFEPWGIGAAVNNVSEGVALFVVGTRR